MLEIFTLGGLEIRLGGRPLASLANHKAGALLCYLAVTGQSRSRAALSGLLWGEATESNARAYLRQALARLRREVAAHVTITHHKVAFNRQAPYWLDVQAFEEGLRRADRSRESPLTLQRADLLAGAVDLYRGDFLAGFYVRRAPAFEEWALVERERLRLAALRALSALTDHYAARGDLAPAIATTQRLLAIEPADEVHHRELMALLARDGQRGAALRQYRLCRRALRDALGPDAQPGEETTALYERIRAAQAVGDASLAPRPAPPHNLSAPLTPLIGRAAELAAVTSRLQDPACRLLTLTGPGGVGKTHLALAAARQLAAPGAANGFDDGVYFIRLGPLESLEAIVSSLAGSLGLAFHKQGDFQQQLLDYVWGKHLLLVLDRFEHLLAPQRGTGPADLVTDILRAAPRVKVLVTSRARLNLGCEHLLPLDGLDCPDGAASEEVDNCSSVRLFVARARQVAPRFRPAADDLAAVARICRHVEGLPLGIMLAAGWSRTLTPAEIAARLTGETAGQDGHGLDLLETDWRDLPARQRGMRAVFDHSWNLLGAREREVFAALSVFRGGFTAEAARQVAGATLRELTALVDQSLLHTTTPGRYEMHDLLRAYAAEKLEGQPAAAAPARAVRGRPFDLAQDRHCAYYTDRLRRWGADLKGPRQAETLAGMAPDIENGRAAWDWAAERGQVTQIDQAMEALCYFYKWRGCYRDGERACRLAVEGLSAVGGGRGRVLTRALAWQGVFSYCLGRIEGASQLLAQSLGLLGEPALADQECRREKAFVLRRTGDVVMHWDRERASGLYEESLSLYRALGDDWGTANVLNALGEVAWNRGAYAEAESLFQESLALRQGLGNRRGIAGSLMWLSRTALYQGRVQESAAVAGQGIEIYREVGDRAGVAQALHRMGVRLGFLGHYTEACATLEEGLALYTHLGFRDALDQIELALGMTQLHLGRYGAARQRGESGLALCRERGLPRGTGLFCLLLGHVALAQGAYAEAEGWLQESVALLGQIGQRAELATAQAVLGTALWGLGQVSQAQQQLNAALHTAVELHAVMPLLYALLGTALLLCEPERGSAGALAAVELYALASSDPAVANSRWAADVCGRHIAAVGATLAPDARAAAQERGRAQAPWEAAEALLVELKGK